MAETPIKITFRPGLQSRAELLSEQLNLPVRAFGDLADLSEQEPGFILCLDERGLSLQQTGPKAPGPIFCDFITGAANHRRLYGGGKNQSIAKAVGLNRQGFKPAVLDLTAGLGQDAFVLATLGAYVTMVERHPIVHALLADGLARAKGVELDDELDAVIARMQLHSADALSYLQKISADDLPDIIYLDPMFPPREKSAKVKKEMQVFHQLVGENNDADHLLAEALTKVCYRVVVKRPAHAPSLGGMEPGYSLKGKSTRFDIYPVKKLPV